MKTLIIGCGNIGTAAAQDLARSMLENQITLADFDKERAKATAERINENNVRWTQLDVTNEKQLRKAMADKDLIMGFLPGKLGYALMQRCIEARKDLIDVSFMEENPLALRKEATGAEVTIIPDCGLAPGISNVLIGHAIAQLDRIRRVEIMVGGLPENPLPPLGYVVTWSPESLIDEYTRRVTIVEKGRKRRIEPLTGIEEIDFPGLGRLEGFYTDGLRSLLETVGGVEEMWEKTLRYPGHAEKISLLSQMGFFDSDPIRVGDAEVSPRKLTARLFGLKLTKSGVKDVAAMSVEVSGIERGRGRTYRYQLLDRFDSQNNVTSMARTTAYPASIVAQMMLEGKVKLNGMIPPEMLGMNGEFFGTFMAEMKKRDINIKESVT